MTASAFAAALARRPAGKPWAYATVSSVQTNTITLTNLNGSTATVAGVHYLTDYTPAANDKVAVLVGSDGDLLVLGKVS